MPVIWVRFVWGDFVLHILVSLVENHRQIIDSDLLMFQFLVFQESGTECSKDSCYPWR